MSHDSSMRLVTLGPTGTFSYDALNQIFPDADIELANNFEELFEKVAQDPALLGFVPVENSLHGSVDEILDLLRETDVKIWRMVEADIHHAFGATDAGKIAQVASHSQALRQCRTWLKTHHPRLQHTAVSSTTKAIEMALTDTSIAAIGLKMSMDTMGLPVLACDIGGRDNTTRFGIVSLQDPFPDLARTQASIVLHPREDYPGLLHRLLTPFKVYDVNLTRIENRPVGSKLGDYYFFIDFLGTIDSPRVRQVLEELKKMADVKVLGEW